MTLEEGRSRLARSTAEGAASLRAAGALLRDPEIRGPDHLAARLIGPGPSLIAAVKVPGVRRLVPALVERLLPGGIGFELARTRYMDEVLIDEVAAGARQVVLLGAGLDSRAYRLGHALAGAAVFEVDHPATAAFKRRRLEAVLGGVPGHVRYVTLDFNREDLATALAAGGHERDARSVVLWSGVAPYLEPAGVDATLRWMTAQAPGSVLAFDYCWQEFVDGDADHLRGAATLRRRVAAQGEPLLSGIPKGRSAEFVAERGLELVEELGSEQGVARYLTRRDGSTAGWMWEFGGMIRARVPGRAAAGA